MKGTNGEPHKFQYKYLKKSEKDVIDTITEAQALDMIFKDQELNVLKIVDVLKDMYSEDTRSLNEDQIKVMLVFVRVYGKNDGYEAYKLKAPLKKKKQGYPPTEKSDGPLVFKKRVDGE